MKVTTVSTLLCLLAAPCLAEDSESPETVISSVVRREGYKCDKPIKAIKDVADSLPDEMAWFLTCKNIKYKVRIIPHHFSEIEVLEVTE